MAKRGRPEGSIARLLDDPGRFELAVWLALTVELGMKPYPAAYLVTFLIASDKPITTESVEGGWLKSSVTDNRRTFKGHADRVVRKAPEAIARADEREFAWLTKSAGLIFALVKFTAESNVGGQAITLDQLRGDGWADTIECIVKRVSASLRSNFPAGQLSPAASRLLRGRTE